MRQITTEEMKDVSGALCSNLTLSLGLTGISLNGQLSDWGDCISRAGDYLNSFAAHASTGIAYGEPHVG